jgi:hypothetical protein
LVAAVRSQEPEAWTPRRAEAVLQSGEPVGEQAEGLRHECRQVPDFGVGLVARERIEAAGVRFPATTPGAWSRSMTRLDAAACSSGWYPSVSGSSWMAMTWPASNATRGTDGKVDDRRDVREDTQEARRFCPRDRHPHPLAAAVGRFESELHILADDEAVTPLARRDEEASGVFPVQFLAIGECPRLHHAHHDRPSPLPSASSSRASSTSPISSR